MRNGWINPDDEETVYESGKGCGRDSSWKSELANQDKTIKVPRKYPVGMSLQQSERNLAVENTPATQSGSSLSWDFHRVMFVLVVQFAITDIGCRCLRVRTGVWLLNWSGLVDINR